MKPNRFGVLSLAFVSGVIAGKAIAQEDAAGQALSAMRTAAGVELSVTRSPRSQLAAFIAAPAGRSIPVPDRRALTAQARALSFLQTYGGAFGLRGAEDVLVSRTERDALGIDHVRLRQVRSGIPVTGGELIVHLRGAGVVAANGKTLDKIEGISLVPTVAPTAATEGVRQFVRRRLSAEAAELSEPRLEIFNQGLLSGRDFPTRLAWFVEAKAENLREFVWVDAKSGIVLLNFSQLTEAKNRAIYTANNGASLPGALIRSEGGAATGDADADLAYNFSGDTYDYYFTNHGRDSFDGVGGQLKSTVHFCPTPASCPYGNAFWNGTQMVYGTGFSSADDVVAHELTHAVTERTANLFYYMQSGALNESFSDIFGETVDLTNGAGNDSGGVRWQLGEDLTGVGAIRNMMTPTLFGDPGKMSDPQFKCELDPVSQDAGGVHGNSGVPNHAYALMVDGGTYNSLTIAGIGLTKAGKIQYRALTQYLISSSDFLDNYAALQQSCADLVGTAGITGGDCAEVTKAVNAVQMANAWPCSATFGVNATPPALCSAGQHAVNTFFDNFETGLSNWSISGDAGTWFRTSDPGNPLGGAAFATSGVDSLWGYNQDVTADSRVGLASNLSIPSGARLQFNHSYGFENDSLGRNWDGGVVEYSTNGGVTWADLSSLYAAGANYGGTISTLDTNPLAGRSAFVKDSFGYTASQYNLAVLAGQTQVRFRFRLGSDSTVDDYGWFIDDFRVYQCVPDAPTPPTVTTNAATTITGSGATLNGTVNPNGNATTAIFEYGLTSSYGTQVSAAPAPGSGTSPVAVSAAISGLTCNTTYHFRASATSAGGTTNGSDLTFTTSACALSVSDVSIAEGNSGTTNAVFAVTLAAPSAAIVTVSAVTSNLTATAGSDYTATGPLTLTFNPGVVSQNFSVPVQGDTALEGDETFQVTLSSPTNAIIADGVGIGTILNDELPSRTFVSSTGTDTADCSVQLAPCRNLAAAIAATSPDGEVIVLTPGEYETAPLTITKGIKITSPSGTVAFIRQPITINAPAGRVVLRGLTLKGNGTGDAITLTTADSLSIEDTTADQWATGLKLANASAARITVVNSTFRANTAGIKDVTGGPANEVMVEESRFEGNGTGIEILASSVRVRGAMFTAHSSSGLVIGPGTADVRQSVFWGNGAGVSSLSGGTVRVSGSHVFGNTVGFSAGAGSTFASYGTNVVRGNGTNTTGTITTIPEQ